MAEQGLPGPKGDKGDPGEQGEPGEAALVPLAQEMVKQLVDGATWSQKSIATLNKTVRLLKKTILALIGVAVVLATVVGYLLHQNVTHPLSNKLAAQLASQQAQTRAIEMYVQRYAQHSCSALELLSSKPVPKPADPAKNPSREITYQFYQAILYWEHADGCKTTTHNVTPVK